MSQPQQETPDMISQFVALASDTFPGVWVEETAHVSSATTSTAQHTLAVQFVRTEISFVRSLQDLVVQLEAAQACDVIAAVKLIQTRHQSSLPHLQTLISPTRSGPPRNPQLLPRSPQPTLRGLTTTTTTTNKENQEAANVPTTPKRGLAPCGVRSMRLEEDERSVSSPLPFPELGEATGPATVRSSNCLSVSPLPVRRTRRGSAPVVVPVEGRLASKQIQLIRRQGSLERLKEQKQTHLKSQFCASEATTDLCPSPRTPENPRRSHNSPSRHIANFLVSQQHDIHAEIVRFAKVAVAALDGDVFGEQPQQQLGDLLLSPIRRAVYYQSFINTLLEHDPSLEDEFGGKVLSQVGNLTNKLQTASV